MATTYKRRSRRTKNGLGMTVLVPSADPASTIINVGILITEGILLGMRNFHAGQHEADQIVKTQNDIGAEMDRISNEAQTLINQDALTQEILESHISRLQTMADEFRSYTMKFSIAGPGARATILGDGGGPGYLMGLLSWLISLRRTTAVSDTPPQEVPPETAAIAVDLGLTVPDIGTAGNGSSGAHPVSNAGPGVLYAANPVPDNWWWLLLLVASAFVARKYL